MHVHLLVPDLIAAAAELRLDAAETLLARGRRIRNTAASTEDWLATSYGLEEGAAAAAFSLLGDGGASSIAGEGWWLRADPVHLRIDRDTLVLADSSVFPISQSEADSLTASLNTHFAPDLEIHALHPERWYARLKSPSLSRHHPVTAGRGQAIPPFLPQGSDAMHWQSIMNEAQMLLHEHPVNEAREARGELPVNSIWLWGAGKTTAVDSRPFDRVLSDDPLARGLGMTSGASVAPLPANAAAWLAGAPESGNTLVALDALRAPTSYAETDVAGEAALQLERDWFAPLLAALCAGRIGMLTLCDSSNGITSETVRTDLNRFWRRRKPLAHYTDTPK